jgi:hypothetical protein
MMSSDIKANRVTSTGSAFAGPARIRGIHVLTDGVGAGRLTITDGSGGTTILDVDFEPASDDSFVNIPGSGIRCQASIFVSALTNITAATILRS